VSKVEELLSECIVKHVNLPFSREGDLEISLIFYSIRVLGDENLKYPNTPSTYLTVPLE
jgi:hypothetical protein